MAVHTIDLSCMPCCSGPCCNLTGAETLAATISDKTGDCVGMPDSLSMPPNGTLTWDSATFSMPCFENCHITFSCVGDTFVWNSVASCGSTGTLVSVTCYPLEIIFDVAYDIECTGTCRVTITR